MMILQSILLMMPPGEGGNPIVSFAFLAAVFGIMYFFMIRPQQKKMKDQRNFLNELKKGDKVVTNGGIHGKIAKVDENTVLLELDSNTKIRVEKSFISVDFSKVLAINKSKE